MRSTLEAFNADIEELKIFVESIEKVFHILISNSDSTLQACLNIRKRLDYTAFIIALYAALEKYVEDIAWVFTQHESYRYSYRMLSDKLQSKHLRQSADLLSRGRLGEGRYSGVTELDVVGNLYACLSGNDHYKLNRPAIVHHDSNLRSEVVQSVFNSLGIDNINDQICRSDSMISWFSISEGLESSSLERVQQAIIDLRLKDLVDRRNQVAHAGVDMADTMNPSEMRERIDFLQAYGQSIFLILAGIYLYKYYIEPNAATRLGLPTEGPYQGGLVVVLGKPSCNLYIGQPIIGIRENRVVRWGKIVEIQLNDVRVETVGPDSNTEHVGLRSDFKITKGTELYALAGKDQIIWE
ncbi:MAG: MAE_28990/MAE_18760 family HEPN-like nuclease [Syntrophobacteraceae bacterium]|nr:MAE_28990/MAE_18760 family HEPN-like nuclease [Syntrophobacteraceae bacterium]